MIDVDKLLAGDRRMAARAISMIENEDENKQKILSQIFPYTGNAFIVGITGSPGAGKSSLTDALTKQARLQDFKVGIIAVDPTSPISGGALLGDRIRMQQHALDRGVFIRSMGTRGCLGGLARATKDAVKVLDAFGCQVIFIETVGVGQSELDIMHYADTTLVVLTPGAGDHIQTIKAGIMEIANIFVINKADLADPTKMVTDIEQMLDMSPNLNGWRPPILKTITIEEKGLPELWETILRHWEYSKTSGIQRENERKKIRREVMDLLEEKIQLQLEAKLSSTGKVKEMVEEILARNTDPYSVANQLLDKFFKI